MRRRACLCDLRASVERACGPHYDRWPVTPSPRRRERPPSSRLPLVFVFPPNETFARRTRRRRHPIDSCRTARIETEGNPPVRDKREKNLRRFRRNREKEREREPLSWHPAQRVQNDAEAGRGEPSRTAPRRGGGGSAGPVVGGGGSTEWEDWARGPRRARGGGRPVCPSSTRPVAFFPGGGRGEGRGEVEEEEERHGGRVGRPTTPPGACPESARILYRARLITSRGVPRWFTAANFSADRPNHRPLTHFCALVLPERTLGLHGRTIVVKVKRSRIISLENNYC